MYFTMELPNPPAPRFGKTVNQESFSTKQCLDAFRLRGRQGLFPFTSGLPQVKGKIIPKRVTKAHLDSPQVTSGEATSDEWGTKWVLSDEFGNYSSDFSSA